MANKENNNPLICDSLGTVTTLDIKVTGILVNPSAGSWVVVLTDKNNNQILRAVGAAATSLPIPIPFNTDGIVATTLTNITDIEIYTDSV